MFFWVKLNCIDIGSKNDSHVLHMTSFRNRFRSSVQYTHTEEPSFIINIHKPACNYIVCSIELEGERWKNL